MLTFQALEQFEIFTVQRLVLEFFNITILNSNLIVYLFLIVIFWTIILYSNLLNNKLYNYNLLNILLESIYKFLLNILLTQLGRIALPFYAYVFSLFFFICYCNLIGIMPFSYTVTSHIIATFTFGFSVLMSLILIGFSYQKLKFLNLFIPKNIPVWLLPLLVVIELVSFFSRGLSLSIRLFANIMSGHVLLNILTGFIFTLLKTSKLAGFFILIIVLAVSCLELFLGVLQAYVFTVLTCIYLSDALGVSSH